MNGPTYADIKSNQADLSIQSGSEKNSEQVDFWTCVRTKPRWEKRFSRWLYSKHIPYYLPVFKKTTTSHRKTRTTEVPVFPGYVFVSGNYNKTDFQYSDCVVTLIKPSCDAEARMLNTQLRDIRRSLECGLMVAPASTFEIGEIVEVVDGPLRGTTGQFIRNGKHGKLVIALELLGNCVAVELTAESRVESLKTMAA